MIPVRGTPERPDPGGVRLDLADPLRPDLLEPRRRRSPGPLAESGEARQLASSRATTSLPRTRDRDAVRLGEPLELALPSRQSRAFSEPGA